MMHRFPNDYELIQLFECEPALTDGNVPWCYNHLAFTSVRGRDRIECEIEPAEEVLQFRWYMENLERVNLDLRSVSGIRVNLTNEEESLSAFFPRRSGLRTLVIQLKPRIRIAWGNDFPDPG